MKNFRLYRLLYSIYIRKKTFIIKKSSKPKIDVINCIVLKIGNKGRKRIYIYIHIYAFLLRTSLTKFDSRIKDKFRWKFGLPSFINRLVELVVVLVVGYVNANNVRRRTINGLCNFRNHSNGRGYNRHTGTTANGTSLFICKVQLCR